MRRGGASRERLQSAKLIEERVQAAELEPSAVVHGALVDLHFLARADVLIGHGGSMFSRLAFFLRWGRTGHVPPYVFVDGASGCCHQFALLLKKFARVKAGNIKVTLLELFVPIYPVAFLFFMMV